MTVSPIKVFTSLLCLVSPFSPKFRAFNIVDNKPLNNYDKLTMTDLEICDVGSFDYNLGSKDRNWFKALIQVRHLW